MRLIRIAFGLLSGVCFCGFTTDADASPITLDPVAISGSSSYYEFPPSGPYEEWSSSISIASAIAGGLSMTASSGSGSHPCCYPGPVAAESYTSSNSTFALSVDPPLVNPPIVAGTGYINGYDGFSFYFTPEPDGTFTGQMDVFEQSSPLDIILIVPVYGYYTEGPNGGYGQSTTFELSAVPEPGSGWLALGAVPLAWLWRRRRIR